MRRVALPLALAALLVATGCVQSVAKEIGPASWPLEMIQADVLHDEGILGEGVTVAIIDTGLDTSHPQFAGKALGWLDLVNDRKEPYDDNGHGTHVAGIVAARGVLSTVWRGFYLQGVAPEARLLVIKAIGADGKGDETKVARAIQAAVANDADVIVLSLGGDSFPILGTETETEVNRAVRAGVFVVAAAGNAPEGSSSCPITSPASESAVIAVGAVREDSSVAPFSCRGTDNDGSGLLSLGGRSHPDRKPEVVAPGDAILSSWSDAAHPGGYAVASGTSQAAPFVGGVIALLLSEHPEYKRGGARGGEDAVGRVKEVLMTTSLKVGPLSGRGPTGHDDRYGYGIVQAKAALDAL